MGGGHRVGLGLLCVAKALRWLSENFIRALIIPVKQNVWNRKRLVLGRPKTRESYVGSGERGLARRIKELNRPHSALGRSCWGSLVTEGPQQGCSRLVLPDRRKARLLISSVMRSFITF